VTSEEAQRHAAEVGFVITLRDVWVEVTRMSAKVDQIDGKLAHSEDDYKRLAAMVESNGTRITALESRRWPTQQVTAVVALGMLILTLAGLVATVIVTGK